MSRRWVPLLVWACFLAALTAIQFVFASNVYYWGTLGGTAVATALFAGYWLWRPPVSPVEYVPDLSYATVAVGAGGSVAAIGVPFGPWLYIPGLGLLAVGLAGVLRELRVERRSG